MIAVFKSGCCEVLNPSEIPQGFEFPVFRPCKNLQVLSKLTQAKCMNLWGAVKNFMDVTTGTKKDGTAWVQRKMRIENGAEVWITLWDEYATLMDFQAGDKLAFMNMNVMFDKQGNLSVGTSRSSDVFLIHQPAAAVQAADGAAVQEMWFVFGSSELWQK